MQTPPPSTVRRPEVEGEMPAVVEARRLLNPWRFFDPEGAVVLGGQSDLEDRLVVHLAVCEIFARVLAGEEGESGEDEGGEGEGGEESEGAEEG